MAKLTQLQIDMNRASKPPECAECSCVETGFSFAPAEGDPAIALLAFLAEALGQQEALKRRPLSGPTGFLLENLLREIGLERKDVLLDNTLRCRPPQNKYPIGKQRAAAEKFCRRWDEKIDQFTHGAFLPGKICTYHPAALFRSPNLIVFLRAALRRAIALKGPAVVLLGDKPRNVWWPELEGGQKRWQGHHSGEYPHVERVALIPAPGEDVGLDLEWSNNRITIFGSTCGNQAYSVPFDRDLCRNVLDYAGSLIGHFLFTADIPALNAEGIEFRGQIWDTAILHYMLNAALCKQAPHDEDGEGIGAKGQGFMDLWSMASLYTDLPQWKQCRGDDCAGPCPRHDIFGYNGLDALAPTIALPKMLQACELRKIPMRLYDHLAELSKLCVAMRQKGVLIDQEYLRDLSANAEKQRSALFPTHLERKPRGKKEYEVYDAPFNPQSPKQIAKFFGLESTDLEAILEAAEAEPGNEWLQKLKDYKLLGKDEGAWFGGIEEDGRVHPRFNPLGTSLGRLASANPNFQNVKRGPLRRAVVSPFGYDLVISDYSQLELRRCLHAAGYAAPLGEDAFKWLVEASGDTFHAIQCENAGTHPRWSARDWAKSVSHAADYLEGITIVKTRTQSAAERAGAMIVYRDWEYDGGWVGFTGVNLAQRLFKSKTFADRRRALDIQEAYFRQFPILRQWHRRITEQAQSGWFQTTSGRWIDLPMLPGFEAKDSASRAKIAAAAVGQGEGADYVQEGMLHFWRDGDIPNLQVHDELVFEIPEEWSNQRALAFVKERMEAPSRIFVEPFAFTCPVKVKRGKNWLDAQEIK